MNEKTKTKQHGSFNVIDFIIFIAVAAVLIFLVYLLFFSNFNIIDKLKGKDQEIEMLYEFEVGPIDDDFFTLNSDLVIQGDAFVNEAEEYSLGEVYSVSAKTPYTRRSDKVMANPETGVNEYVYCEHPGYSTVVITVSVSALRSGGTYTIDGHTLKIGDVISFSTPVFSGSAKCISINEKGAAE